jgi:hypothetical protein
MAMTAMQMPDFTAISHFIRSLKDDIRNIFNEVLFICSELDPLYGTTFAHDGCKVPCIRQYPLPGSICDRKYFNRNYFMEMKAKIDTTEGRDIYSQRMGIIRPVFGNIRSAKNVNRFTLRTRAKVTVQ